MLPVTVLNKKIPTVVKIAPPKSTPVCPKAFTTGPAKNLPTAITPVVKARINMPEAPLWLNTILDHCCGPNSEIAVKAIAKNRKINTGLNMALKLEPTDVTPSTEGLGKALPKKSTA